MRAQELEVESWKIAKSWVNGSRAQESSSTRLLEDFQNLMIVYDPGYQQMCVSLIDTFLYVKCV